MAGPVSRPRLGEETSHVWGPASPEHQEAGPETGLETGQTPVQLQGPSSKLVSKSGCQETALGTGCSEHSLFLRKKRPLWAGLASQLTSFNLQTALRMPP